MKNFSILILAAGKGTRMNTPDTPKVLAPLLGKPLIYYVLTTALSLNPSRILPIIGYRKELVAEYIKSLNINNIEFVEQNEQLGTGHAVDQARERYVELNEGVLILSGDVPMLSVATLQKFVNYHFDVAADLSVLSAKSDNPFGYGRIIRTTEGDFENIIEEKDANSEQKLINEINSGIYFVNSSLLFDSLSKVQNNNAQKEYYLTDIVGIIKSNGGKVIAKEFADFREIQGINTNAQLSEVEELMKSAIQ